ncbi:transmembrane secretion effector [Kribbella sp. VKM Ac-2527]|uniref:Transmembrane secretion effector n=1 Tax=Kribbella caucasensis TaxID=2512215 RepID=A0A4R6J7C3_9ACTN|nr:MFS transporter [Kribbella sp. VKM Ac-2527]TDO30215.1 transmembrane secretion effector [Kribbella sp. VKM Ac-2527]
MEAETVPTPQTARSRARRLLSRLWKPTEATSLTTLLRRREFRLLFNARLITYIGDSVSPIAVAFAVLEADGSSADVGFALTARIIPLILLVLLGGILADRASPISVMMFSDLVQGVAQAGLAALLLTQHASIGLIVVSQILYGVGYALQMPSLDALIPRTVDKEQLQAANSALFLALGIAFIGAPAVGGFAIASVGAGVVVAIDAATFVVSFALLWSLHRVLPISRVPAEPGLLHSFSEGWAELRARPSIGIGIIFGGTYGAAFVACISVVGPVSAVEWLGGSAGWGLVMSCVGLGLIGGAAMAMRLEFVHPLRVGFLILVLSTPLMFTIGLRAPHWLVLAAAVIAGVSIQWFNALWNTVLQAVVLPDFRARVSSYDSLVSWSLRTVLYSVAGPIALVAGLRATWMYVGALLIALCLLPLLSLEVRNLRLSAEERPPPTTAE